MPAATRLRQVALVASVLDPVATRLRDELGLGAPFHDESVAEFGLENAVFALGDAFLEIVAPTRPDTAAGRYLARQGGDGGYMAIFEVPDLTAARKRVADLGVRVAWQVDLADMAGTHLHPKDVPGAIVSLDHAHPPGSWRWAGPAWAGRIPRHGPGTITGLTVGFADSAEASRAAARWAAVLGEPTSIGDGATVIPLDGGRQILRFAPSATGREGISDVEVVADPAAAPSPREIEICGVRFVLRPRQEVP